MKQSVNRILELTTHKQVGRLDEWLGVNSETFIRWRHGSGHSVEIIDISVSAEHRRQGFGRGLVQALLTKLLHDETKTVYAITRASNLIAQEFYEALKFRACPLRDFYKDEPLADGKRYTDAIMYIWDVGALI